MYSPPMYGKIAIVGDSKAIGSSFRNKFYLVLKFGFKIKIDYTQLQQFVRIQADSFGQTVKTQTRPLPEESDQSPHCM